MKPSPLAALALAAALLAPAVQAQKPGAAAQAASNTALDAALFYQLLIGEFEAQRGELGTAYQVLLDAARRTGDEGTYRRVIELALQARAGNEAYAAARSWRQQTGSLAAQQYVLRLAIALGRLPEAGEPLVDWLQKLPDAEQRAGLLGALPQLLRSLPERERPLNEMEPALAALRDDSRQSPERRMLAAASIAALARHADNEVLALNQLREAAKERPGDPLPAWMALDLMRAAPAAEALVQAALPGQLGLHQAYARALARDHRSQQALAQFQGLAELEPQQAAHRFAIATLELELRHPEAALTAVGQYLQQLGAEAKPELRTPALLLQAQAHQRLRQWPQALTALDAIPSEQQGDEVAFRRASIEAAQGRMAQARERLRALPADTDEARERRLLLEVQLLREHDQWPATLALLEQALQADPQDTELLYEHAMSAERLGQHALMEQQLRRVIELNPRHYHAHNALGYSLADRNERLPEARQLIERAIELGGHEPFLVDSLGWLAFREGNLSEAERLLRQAYQARPDAEIAAHLAELLWRQGARDEARAVAERAQAREPDNTVLRDTRRRLGL